MFSKAELDKLNAERERLQKQSPPTMRPTPGGNMRADASREDEKARQERLQSIAERSKAIQQALDKQKNVARDSFKGL